ncbi:hypothetical protein QVD17_06956 [Tagetes erecta]|uniref:Reverse transcriptase zinc-binding domain-containing protein n=1 Tax=Tagetes erecta TaxID=13708 RepID=A0AAD8LGX6_TARER|nr:hypothetical protein QVD17_06956 [Tagetes erecta]
MSWGWQKILQLSETIRPYIRQKIGDGKNTFIWSDNWCDQSPLSRLITPRDIYMAGFSRMDRVADMVIVRNWIWPAAWYDLFHVLINIQVWKEVRMFTDLEHIEGNWENIVLFLVSRGNWNSSNTIIDRLEIGATSYYVWQERNARIFNSTKRSPKQISALILDNVRMKLVSLRKKKVFANWITRKGWDLEQIEDKDG